MRSSPQFGFTLASYEFLQTLLPMPGSASESAQTQAAGGLNAAGNMLGVQSAESHAARMPYLRSKNALKIILDIDENFGRPKGLDAQGWSKLPKIVGGKK